MKSILKKLIDYKTLTEIEAKEILINISQGNYSQSEVIAFMTVFMMRLVTVEELNGFRKALLEQCFRVDFSDFNCIDLCGTGGDGKDTFNISTLSSFVVAGAGYAVAKHGNYGLSSVCGSSNVLEYFSYKFTNNEAKLKKQLNVSGICFLHAPLFHPAMKAVASIRKELRIPTFFNVLGPMLNPSTPPNQLVGVFSLTLARHYSYVYQQSNVNYSILHALDGYDEISLTGKVKIINNNGERILSPYQLGFSTYKDFDIKGGETIEDASRLFKNILSGEGSKAHNDVVIANAAQAIQCINPSLEYGICKEQAEKSLLDLNAYDRFKKLLSI